MKIPKNGQEIYSLFLFSIKWDRQEGEQLRQSLNLSKHELSPRYWGEARGRNRPRQPRLLRTKRSDSREQPPVSTPSLSLYVIEFPLICCKLAAFFHLLFFARRQIITVDTWKVTQKNDDDASHILIIYLDLCLLFTLILAFLRMNESPIDRAHRLSHSF